MTNVIGDIAGQYKTLMALIDKMPEGETISVGDMVDRGPHSREVLEFFMDNDNTRALMGNHEHMMLDFYKGGPQYGQRCWLSNGGRHTAKQFPDGLPVEHMDFLKGLPLFIETENCLITHGFVTPSLGLEQVCEEDNLASDSEISVIWGREYPERMEKYELQLAGHNSHFGLKRFSGAKGEFAVCLDTSRDNILTGIHLPSKKIYQQSYID